MIAPRPGNIAAMKAIRPRQPEVNPDSDPGGSCVPVLRPFIPRKILTVRESARYASLEVTVLCGHPASLTPEGSKAGQQQHDVSHNGHHPWEEPSRLEGH